jgi:hypothetical protein
MDAMQDVERIASEAISAHISSERVRHLKAEPYLNSLDQEGLRIRLVIGDDDPLPADGNTFLDILLDVSDRLSFAGEHRVPTLTLITEDELARIGDPDD